MNLESFHVARVKRIKNILRGIKGIILPCFLFCVGPLHAQETNLELLTIHVGFTRSSFRNVNAHDATTAFRVFAQTAGRRRGHQVVIDARLFETSEECAAEIRNGHINMAILDTWDYLGMNIEPIMEPVFVELEHDSIFKEYLLLTHQGSGLTNLANLRGKDLLVLEGKGGDLSRAWLDWLLQKDHLEPKETFFSKLEPVGKPASAILPVFFGKKPSCLVDRAAFQLMAELNPQVGANLAITVISEPYLENVTCIRKDGWPSEKARKDLIQGIAELQLEPDGQQVLQLFKIDQMMPFKDEYLDSARKLQQARSSLARSQGL